MITRAHTTFDQVVQHLLLFVLLRKDSRLSMVMGKMTLHVSFIFLPNIVDPYSVHDVKL